MLYSFKYLFVISIFQFIVFPSAYAQPADVWYFGHHAGLSFNTSPASALENAAIDTDEGCATISDENGNLLFYTDGVTVYSKNHLPMLNGTGLKGHTSSVNSAIVIPKPGSNSIYYIFTADASENKNALGYNCRFRSMLTHRSVLWSPTIPA